MGLCSGKQKNQNSQSQQRTSCNNTQEKGPESVSIINKRSDNEKITRTSQHHQLTVLFESFQIQRDQLNQSPRIVRSHQTLKLSKKAQDTFQFIENDFVTIDTQNHWNSKWDYYVNKYTGRIYFMQQQQNAQQATIDDLVRLNKQLLIHPHITEIIILEPEEEEKKKKIYFEFCQGDTLDTFHQKMCLSLEQISILVSQILEIATHLHSQKLYHNNLSLQSFTFFQDNRFFYLKLTDINGLFTENKMNDQKIKSAEIDIEQIGFITFQLLSTKSYEINLSQKEQEDWLDNIKKNLILPQTIIGINARALILGMLQQKPANKLKLEQIRQNQFIQIGNLEFIKLHKQKLVPKNSHKKINYLQKCFTVFIIQNFFPYQYFIMKKIYDNLEKDEEQNLNLISFCQLLQEIFNNNEDVTQDYRYIIELNESINFRDFLVMNSNITRYLSTENLRNSFHILSNKSQYISRKSILNMMDANSQNITKEFQKHCLKWRFTYDHYLQFMERIK